MDYLSSILLFFVYLWGLGFTATSFVKKQENLLERHIMNIGVGLGVFILLGLVLNFLHVKLHWWIFLIASILFPFYYLIRNHKGIIEKIKSPKIRLTKYSLSIIALLIIFFAVLYMYEKGSFSYPYFEDDDPWSHSLSIKYVSVEKTLNTPESIFHFLDPYPPAYNFVMGVTHQTNDSIYWTMKFFNALIISLSILFFYFFVRELTGSYGKALFSSLVLAAIPSYMTHFIWSLGLSLTLYPIAFYALEKIKEDKKWSIPSLIVIAAAFTASPSHSFYFGIFLGLYLIAKIIIEKRILIYEIISSISGFAVSLIVWWIPAVMKYGFTGMLNNLGMRLGRGNTLLSVDGTGDRIYLMKDFARVTEVNNSINNSTGLGIIVSLLLIFSIAYFYYIAYILAKKSSGKIKYSALGLMAVSALLFVFGLIRYRNSASPKTEVILILSSWMLLAVLMAFLGIVNKEENVFGKNLISVLWFILAFYAVNGVLFPYKVSAFRVWMILSIPVAILAAEGLWFFINLIKRFRLPGFLITFLVIALSFGIVMTSGIVKYKINTSAWSPGGFWVYLTDQQGKPIIPELSGYINMKTAIPNNARVFTFSNDATVIGFDKFICHWCKDEIEFKKIGFNSSASGLASWLREKDYEYLAIDGETAKKYGVNQTIQKIQEIASSGFFRLKLQTQQEYGIYGMFLFSVS